MRTIRELVLWAAVAAGALAVSGRADAETAGAEAARATYRALVRIEANQPPSGSGPGTVEEDSIRALKAWRRQREAALAEFHRAFAAADYVNWPASGPDAPLLERGLLDLGESLLRKADGARAAQAFGRAATLSLTPDGLARVDEGLPAAHLANRDAEEARKHAAAAAVRASGDGRPRALARQGDIELATGRTEEALALYAKASETAPADEGTVFGVDAVAALEARWKRDLLGKTFDMAAVEWGVGVDRARWLADAAGNVVVLCFPDPYAAEQFDPSPYVRLVSRGTVVAAVLTDRMTLRLPQTLLDYPTDSSPRLRGEPQPADVREWAARFRRVAKIPFPAVGIPAAKLPLGRAVLRAALLVDRSGKIAYVKSADEPFSYLAAAAERLLAPR